MGGERLICEASTLLSETEYKFPSRCPKCNFTLDSADQIFPNFLFNELVSKYKNSLENRINTSNLLQHPDLSAFRTSLSSNFESMSLPDVELMLKLLEAKKQQLAANSVLAQKQLLKEFLQHLKKQKDEQLFALQKEAAVIQVICRLKHSKLQS